MLYYTEYTIFEAASDAEAVENKTKKTMLKKIYEAFVNKKASDLYKLLEDSPGVVSNIVDYLIMWEVFGKSSDIDSLAEDIATTINGVEKIAGEMNYREPDVLADQVALQKVACEAGMTNAEATELIERYVLHYNRLKSVPE